MNMLLFVWTIIFISCSGDSGDSGDGGFLEGAFEEFDELFKSSVIDFFPESDSTCPCTPRGEICDILATCQQGAGTLPLWCDGGSIDFAGFAGFGVLFCGNDPLDVEPFFPLGILEFLFTPVFVQINLGFLLGDIGICASSPFGIIGIIRAIIENIEDLIDEFLECDASSTRRLQDGTKSPFNGDPKAFQNFVELLEWKGGAENRQELIQMIFKEGGIGHLAAIMKQKQSPSGTRRLLDDSGDGEGDEFGLCDFLFMQDFFGPDRRRLSIDGPFNPETDAFEYLLSELFTSADCENNMDSTTIICVIKHIMNNPNRRRLDSDDDSGESGDGGEEDRFDFSCCGGFDVGTSIQLTTIGQSETCEENIADAGECLNGLIGGEPCFVDVE